MNKKILSASLLIYSLIFILAYPVTKTEKEPPSNKNVGIESEKGLPIPNKYKAGTTERRLPLTSTQIKSRVEVEGNVEQVIPQTRVIPPPYRLRISVWTDRDTYRIGDNIRIYFKVNRPSYVYIFNTTADGVTRQIFPNYFDRNNYIYSGWTYYIPDQFYSLLITGPRGRENIQAIAISYRYPFIEEYHQFKSSAPFPKVKKGGMDLIERYKNEINREGMKSDESKSGVVKYKAGYIIPSPNFNEYAEDWASFEVVGDYYDYDLNRDRGEDENDWGDIEQGSGELRIKTDPKNATIIIDGINRGTTPKNFILRPGFYTVTLKKSGYRKWYSNVQVQGDSITEIRVRLMENQDAYSFKGYQHNEDVNIYPRKKSSRRD